MDSAKEYITLEEAFHTLGLEKSRIRFIEREFGAYFGFSRLSPFPNLYSRKQLVILEKINSLLNRPDLSVGQIKSQFQGLCLERGKGVWILTVTSGKGGVGKTFLSTSLAVMLARRGIRTVLFDADFGLANAHVFLGINPKASIVDLLYARAGMEEILVEGPCGMKLIPGSSGVAQLADLNDHQRDRLVDELNQLRKVTDVLVIDTAAGVSKNVLKFIGLADEVLVLSTPNIAATLDAFGLTRAATQHQEVSGNLNLIVNRARNRAQADQVFDKMAQCMADFLGKKVKNLGYIYEDSTVEESIQNRMPLVNLCPDSPAVLCLEEIVQQLLQAKKSWKGGEKAKLLELFMPLEV